MSSFFFAINDHFLRIFTYYFQILQKLVQTNLFYNLLKLGKTCNLPLFSFFLWNFYAENVLLNNTRVLIVVSAKPQYIFTIHEILPL